MSRAARSSEAGEQAAPLARMHACWCNARGAHAMIGMHAGCKGRRQMRCIAARRLPASRARAHQGEPQAGSAHAGRRPHLVHRHDVAEAHAQVLAHHLVDADLGLVDRVVGEHDAHRVAALLALWRRWGAGSRI